MKRINITTKDLKEITETCVKNILKEGYFDSLQPDKYQSTDKREMYLKNICNKIGGGDVDSDGYKYFVESPNGNAEIVLYIDRNTNGLEIYTAEVSKMGKIENIDDAILTYKWMTDFLIMLKTNPFRG